MTNTAPTVPGSAASSHLLDRLSPPGHVEDFAGRPELETAWSRYLRGQFRLTAMFLGKLAPDGKARFTAPVDPAASSGATTRVVAWNAFPKRLRRRFGPSPVAWREADTPQPRAGHTVRIQDEYVEWFVERDAATGKIRRVTFTSELPEYWEFLAYAWPDFVFRAYQQYVDPHVPREQVFPGGPRYSPLNVWNGARGLLHMQNEVNTLDALLSLVCAGTVLRALVRTAPHDDPEELLAQSGAGDPCRASDVTLSVQADELATAGYQVTLLDPVGVYLGELNTAGWTKPNGTPVDDYWRIVRGTPDYPVRAIYEVPAGEEFLVGDLRIGGRPLEYGAQLAEHLTVRTTLVGHHG